MKIESRGITALALDQRGIAFVVSLVTMLVLVILGYGILVATDGSTRAETSLKAQESAVEVADAGIEYARERIRACLAGTGPVSVSCNNKQTLTSLLGTARNGNTLVDSTSLAGFNTSSTTTATNNGTNNTPFVVSDGVDLTPSAFQVFLTNDPGGAGSAESLNGGVQYATDTNQRVTLTSFAAGPNGIGYAVVQAVVETPLNGLNNLFQATLILPGPDVNFSAPNSNPYKLMNAGCNATIAVTSNAARTTVWNGIPSNRRDSQHYGDGCTPADTTNLGVYNYLPNPNNPYPGGGPTGGASDPIPPAGPPAMPTLQNQNLITVNWYQNYLLPMLSAVANFRSTSDPGFNYGTATSPQIVYLNTDPNANISGYGILVVTSNLTLDGNSSYHGLILAVGAGHVTVNGGGNGGLDGTMVVVNLNTPYSGDSRFVGIPYYNANGGGNSNFGLGGNVVAGIPFTGIASPRRISFLQLR